MKSEITVVIKNESGLHARPAGLFVKKASEFASQVQINFDGKTANAKSIMGLMGLGLQKGSKITLVAEGQDSTEAVKELRELVESGFGEM